jgi:ribonuclease P protein component
MGRFGPADRVRKRSEFRRAQGNGRRATSRHFVVLVFAREVDGPAETRGRTRLGLVVSRKVGNAVRRNRVKRLIREAFRHCHAWRLPNIDLVVIPRQLPARLGMEQVLTEFRGLTAALEQRAAQAENDREIRQSKLAAGRQTTHTGARRP